MVFTWNFLIDFFYRQLLRFYFEFLRKYLENVENMNENGRRRLHLVIIQQSFEVFWP